MATDKTTLRRATDGDIDLLVAWHADPEVSKYWDDHVYTPELVREKLARDRVGMWIVEENGVPVGMLQHWREEDAPLRGGLDGFLVPSARGDSHGNCSTTAGRR